MSTIRFGRPLSAAAAVAVLLSGCGSVSPGTAATVGDETITVDQVDDAAAAVCSSVERELKSGSQVVAMSQMKQYALSLLAAAAEGRQIAEEYDIDPGATVERQRAQFEAQAETLPEDLRDDYVAVMSAETLVTAVLTEAGREALEAEGVEGSTTDEIGQRGSDIFATWPDSNGIEVDPRYGLELVDGRLQQVDRSLSVPVSETALAGAAADPEPAYVRSLPQSQRCG